ncbi:oxidoreductase [Kosmotoga pacifica]|uniref:Oxidoreductase n=1 Tax=Kosmotoga pacifica TaxID=1330330 RepID=A0A0G2Z9K2_9BACT|nr:oxidoreductase [Kosmotoga pacifica]
MKIGVIGLGRLGRIHTTNLVQHVPEAEVKILADPRVEETEEWGRNLGDFEIVADWHIPLKDPEIDAVVIASPTTLHGEMLKEAVKAGKHVFMEKPLAHDLETAKELFETLSNVSVKIQIAFNRRFDHNFRKIKSFIDSGKLGEVHLIRTTSRDPHLPDIEFVKKSGGIFFDFMIHEFDTARFLTGSEVVEVYAGGSVLLDPRIGEAGDFDTAYAMLKMENGAICVIDVSRKAVYGYDQRVEVFGSKGSARAENDRETNVIMSTEEAVCTDKPLYYFPQRYMKSFANEIEAFVESVLEEKPVSVGVEAGYRSILIARAADVSARENRPVRIAELL